MAFKEKQSFVGTVPTQKLGEAVAISDKYMVSAGQNFSRADFYEKDDEGVWRYVISNNGWGGSAWQYGKALDIYKKNIFVSSIVLFSSVFIYSADDGFSSGIANYFRQSSPDGSVEYGESVSASDNFVAVGAPLLDSSGGVYIYEKTGDEWTGIITEDYIISSVDSQESQLFGTSVSIDGDIIAIGAKGDDSSRGAVYIFERNEETNIWEQSQKLIASDGVAGDEFGGKVSLSGNYLAIGAEFTDTSDTKVNTGAVYIFTLSDVWNQLRKITSVGESGLIANQFGHSVDLKGDYLVVGSPNARGTGVADVFYRKRDWGHLKKITSDQITGNLFGDSVGIDYPNLIVGASGFVETTDEGKVYIFEDPEVRLRLSQEFDADFLPSKASVYLKRGGSNLGSSWSLTDSKPSIIDATNFSSIEQSTHRIILDDRVAGFTGNGYMIISTETDVEIEDVDSSFSVINYPVRSVSPDFYNIWIRVFIGDIEPSGGVSDPSSSTDLSADLLLDGIIVKSLDTQIVNGQWGWIRTTLVLPDTQNHILGIKIKEASLIIDKIYIDVDTDFTPEGDGPPHDESPYVTTHMKVYAGDGSDYPVYPIHVYDYKTSLDETIQDDWYNFNITIMGGDEIVSGGTISITSITGTKIPFTDAEPILEGNFFLVMSSSGASADNFITWEIIDSDEYLSGYAGLRLTEIALNSNSVYTNLNKRLYYKAKAGNADINTDTWYLDNTKTHAFKIYSDFDPIEDV